jgi:hypothetical protein
MTLRKLSIVLSGAVMTFGIFCLALRVVAQSNERPPNDRAKRDVDGAKQRDDAAAASAFEAIIPVLHHPRCMNCHSTGDFPRQGDNGHKHTMNVRRGSDGHGGLAVKCSTCHQNHNLEGLHVPPGAPEWHLSSPAMPMIWEGLTDRQLCELLKDPKQNGNRNVDQIVEHMSTPLVLWSWSPGEGRAPIPMPEAEFLAKVTDWASKGAACPAAGSAALQTPVGNSKPDRIDVAKSSYHE